MLIYEAVFIKVQEPSLKRPGVEIHSRTMRNHLIIIHGTANMKSYDAIFRVSCAALSGDSGLIAGGASGCHLDSCGRPRSSTDDRDDSDCRNNRACGQESEKRPVRSSTQVPVIVHTAPIYNDVSRPNRAHPAFHHASALGLSGIFAGQTVRRKLLLNSLRKRKWPKRFLLSMAVRPG